MVNRNNRNDYLFGDGGPSRLKNVPFICSANQWIGLYLIRASVMKKVNFPNIYDFITQVEDCWKVQLKKNICF